MRNISQMLQYSYNLRYKILQFGRYCTVLFNIKQMQLYFTYDLNIISFFCISGEKPFVCSVCSKAYARKSHLNVHFRVHTGERPFACVHCEKDFTEKRFLNDHIQTAHTGNITHKRRIQEWNRDLEKHLVYREGRIKREKQSL